MGALVEPHSLAGREGGHVTEMQRRRLLLAFSELLAQSGWAATSVDRVCKRAGVSRRTFYDVFSDREACFVAVLDDVVERCLERVLPAYSDGGRWRERMRLALAALLEFFDGEPALARVCLEEAPKAGEGVAKRRARVLDRLIDAIDEGRSEASGAAPPPLTACGTVGGAISVIHARVLADDGPLIELLNQLMCMIVLPYLGAAAARREQDRPIPESNSRRAPVASAMGEPFKDLPIRITLRTARVLATIGAQPGASNRQVGDAAGVGDQGQISKLLKRLEGYGLIENNGRGHTRGEANVWRLTERGHAIQHALQTPTP